MIILIGAKNNTDKRRMSLIDWIDPAVDRSQRLIFRLFTQRELSKIHKNHDKHLAPADSCPQLLRRADKLPEPLADPAE